MKFIQVSCIEGNEIDLRQADAILKHKPNIIFFEAPSDINSHGSICNKFPPKNKPLQIVREYQSKLRKVARKYKWVSSDVYVYDNIVELWKKGHDIKLYDIDGPTELLRVVIDNKWNKIKKPRRRGVHLPWWVYIYLRERTMADNITKVVNNQKKSDLVALVFLQKFHWLNVSFLLTKPSKKKIFQYYFGKFKNLSMSNINTRVREINNNTLSNYWSRRSDL